MNSLIEFLTSKEIMIVYMISAAACLLCLIVYLVEKNNEHVRRKHNTKELNKLVELVKQQMPELEPEITYDTPVLEKIEDPSFEVQTGFSGENNVIEIDVKEDNSLEVEKKEEIEYTSVEPNEQAARQELEKIQKELEKEESTIEELPTVALSNYEEEQEKTAIISLDEFLNKSREMYEKNEQTQYMDEGNEPISLSDLEEKMNRVATKYEEPFIIANVVSTGEVDENAQVEVIDEEIKEQLQQKMIKETPVEVLEETKEEPYQDSRKKKFVSSPFISPIFGIQKDARELDELALENTATFEKLDQKLQSSNELIVSLKELQGK